jgi:hypothetical protein
LPGAAVVTLKLLQPVANSEAAERTSASAKVSTPAFRLRSRQKIHPKHKLRGKNRPANATLLLPAPAFRAEAPPLNGLLESIESCTLAFPPAKSLTVGLEKWQETPAGSDAQPNPTVSVKVPFELRFTVTVAFCDVAMVTLEGVTPRLNGVGVPETGTAGEVEVL